MGHHGVTVVPLVNLHTIKNSIRRRNSDPRCRRSSTRVKILVAGSERSN